MIQVDQVIRDRLEKLWAGKFGRRYTERNFSFWAGAGCYHLELCRRLQVQRVLEVGCNLGFNLTHLVAEEDIGAWGIDINRYALALGKQRLPAAHLVEASAYHLPFTADVFDLVFTCGVLIHFPPENLGQALAEIHRVSRRYIWCGEYFSPEPLSIPYRGLSGALFKRDFGAAFLQAFPDLSLLNRGFLAKKTTGFDNLTWWLLEKG